MERSSYSECSVFYDCKHADILKYLDVCAVFDKTSNYLHEFFLIFLSEIRKRVKQIAPLMLQELCKIFYGCYDAHSQNYPIGSIRSIL